MNRTVGIDFGTSTTLLARSVAGQAEVLPLGAGGAQAWIPSVARAAADGSYAVSETAARAGEGVIRSIKQDITEPGSCEDGQHVSPGGQHVPVDDVVRAILTTLVQRADRVEPGLLTNATVRLGCPAMWDTAQRRRLVDVARAAGLPVDLEDLVDEPVAAGASWVARRVKEGQDVNGRVLVVDYGGGTLDLAVLDVVSDGGRLQSIKVMSSDSHPFAGDHLDQLLAQDLHDRLRLARSVSVGDAKLREGARQLKELLSDQDRATIPAETGLGVAELQYDRRSLEMTIGACLRQGRDVALAVLRAAELRDSDAIAPPALRAVSASSLAERVDYVLLSGGTSLVPAVADCYREVFSRAEVVRHQACQEAVVSGLALEEAFESLNLHRPGFSIVSIHPDGSHRPLYDAFAPLYTRDQVLRGETQLGHRVALLPSASSRGRREQVFLQLRDVKGRVLRVQDGESELKHLGLVLDPLGDSYLKLYVDGRLVVHTPTAGTQVMRMTTWPVTNGHREPVLHVDRVPRSFRDFSHHGVPGEPG